MNEHLERQELGRLMASPHLSGKRAREALEFLCERYWSGEKVTQYDLSEKLYGTVENSVAARNLVKNLRQKLALHYGSEGRGSPVRLAIPSGQYNVVFERHDAERADAAETPERAVRGRKAPRKGKARPYAGLLTAAVVLALLTSLTVVLLPGFIGSRRPPAVTLSIDGGDIVGRSAEGADLWREPVAGPIYRVVDLGEETANRFVVLHGGIEDVLSPPSEMLPRVSFYSSRGEALDSVDLLGWFNPFRETHDQRYFRFAFCRALDIDQDGHRDVLVSCKHLYYPNLLYAVSGRKMEAVSAFANSGKVKDLVRIDTSPGAPGAKVAVLAVNNPMGEQLAVFMMPTSGRLVSPDQGEYLALGHPYYRPVGLSGTVSKPFRCLEGNLLQIGDLERDGVLLDAGSMTLKTDPWFTDHGQQERTLDSLAGFYSRVLEARRLVRDGIIGEGQALYDLALSEALDEALGIYALLDAARELKRAGEPQLALERLPERPGDVILPRRVMLLRGELLTILGDDEGAKEAFLAANYVHYSFPGFVQADILGGASGEELYQDILRLYPSKLNVRATRAWLKIPALLSGESTMPDAGRDGAYLVADEAETRDDHIRFEQESAIWNAFVDLELGLEPRVWPDGSRRPMEYGGAFPAKMTALEACRELVERGAAAALPRLESAYLSLSRAALTDHEVQIPFVQVAYACGFAAAECGRDDLARAALGAAVKRYPHGLKYRRARQILAAMTENR